MTLRDETDAFFAALRFMTRLPVPARVGHGGAGQFDPLVGVEQVLLGRVSPDGDDHLAEQRGGAVDHVEMPVRDWVERPWAHGSHASPSVAKYNVVSP